MRGSFNLLFVESEWSAEKQLRAATQRSEVVSAIMEAPSEGELIVPGSLEEAELD